MAEDQSVPENNEGQESGGGASEEQSYKKLEFKSEEEEKEHYNQKFRERDSRIRDQIRQDLETEVRESIEAELRQQKAQEEGDYETLVTELADKVTERDEKIKKLEARIEEERGGKEQILIRSAVEKALTAEGVDPKRVDAAFRHVDLTKVEVKENDEVKGAAKAAEAAKEEIPELFTGTVTVIGGVPPSPKPKQKSGSKYSYNPNYSRPA